MLSYIVCYTVSILLLIYGEYRLKFSKRMQFEICAVISIVIPSILAGCRDYNIGTDIYEYGNIIFESAVQSSNFTEFINSSCNLRIENLYLLLNYIVAQFTDNPHWLYFFISIITTSFVFMGIYKNKDKFPIWMGMFVYYFMFFQESLNLMRQYMAMAIVFYGLSYVFQKRYIRYIIIILIAVQFHLSAFLGLFFVLAYLVIQGRFNGVKQIVLISGTFMAVFFVSTIVQIFINIGIFPSHYSGYVSGGSLSLQINSLILRVPILILLLINYRKLKIKQYETSFLILLFFLEAILIQLKSIMVYAVRISTYFALTRVFLFGKLSNIAPEKSCKKMLNVAIIIVYVIVYWYYYFILMGANETYPYTSEILRIF